ncbi:MAG: hypothetical protein WHU10_09575, partial [Fimbriimonadales bacterium]
MEPALPKARFLDPRAEEEAASAPIAEAANVPWDRLRERRHELPQPAEVVWVARTGPEAERAVATLAELGYEARLADGWVRAPAARRWRLWEPNPLLVPCPLPPGEALDLGCGSGRDAVWLAAHGWRVAFSYLSNAGAAEETRRAAVDGGGQALPVQADVSEEAGRERL